METIKKPKKPGPVPGPPTVKATILIEEKYADWGKRQPGGLSELVRKLLREAYEERQSENDARSAALLSERALSHEWDTPEEDAAWQHL